MLGAIELYAMMITSAMPFALVFCVGNLIVDTFLRTAFGGRLEFR